jgi:hypothetical protein
MRLLYIFPRRLFWRRLQPKSSKLSQHFSFDVVRELSDTLVNVDLFVLQNNYVNKDITKIMYTSIQLSKWQIIYPCFFLSCKIRHANIWFLYQLETRRIKSWQMWRASVLYEGLIFISACLGNSLIQCFPRLDPSTLEVLVKCYVNHRPCSTSEIF